MSLKEKVLTQPILPGGTGFTAGDRTNLVEIVQRARRIETRLTRLLETEGIQTGIQRPWWMGDGRVMIPSPMTTIDAIIKVIPRDWAEQVHLVLKDDQNVTILCRLQL